MQESGGRYISLAVLCEKILREQDGVLSLIRVIDRYTIAAPSPNNPMAPLMLNFAIVLRAGIFRGPATLKLRPVLPSGTALNVLEFPVNFEGDDERGVATMVTMGFLPAEEGRYWFDVILDEELITRIPLKIVYLRPATVTPYHQNG